MKEVELVFKDIPISLLCPSPNRALRMHWSRRKVLKKKWTQYFLEHRHKFDIPIKKCRLILTRGYVNRRHRLDPDNLTASFKYLIDAMIDAGILEDDSADVVVSLECRQVKQKRKDHCIRVYVDDLT